MALPIAAIMGLGGKILDRVIPDPEARAAAKRELAVIQQQQDMAFLDAEIAIITGQIETNKIEAQHGGRFKGGWRPFIGWVCGVALAYKFIMYPFAVSVVQIIAHFTGADPFPLEYLPVVEWGGLSMIVTGMLGLGGLRTFEKRQTARG